MQPQYRQIHPFFAIFLIACAVPVLFTACDTGTLVEPKPKAMFAAQTLTIACPDPIVREILANHGKVWSSARGAKPVVVPKPLADVPNADIGIVPTADLGRYAIGNELQVLPDALRNPSHSYHYDYLSTIYREKLLTWDNQPIALPITGESCVFVYRRNIVDQTKITPTTWDAIAKIAKFYADKGQLSLPPLPDDDLTLDRDFFGVAATLQRPSLTASDPGARPTNEDEASQLFAFQYDLITGEPRIATPAFVEALKWFQSVQKYRAKDAKPIMWISTLRELSEHPLTEEFAISVLPGSTEVYDFVTGNKAKPIQLINRVPYTGWGGTLGVVRKSSTQQEAAFDLLAFLGDPTTTGAEIIAEPRWGAGPLRNPQTELQNQKLWNGYTPNADQITQLMLALRDYMPSGLVNPVLTFRLPDHEARTKIVATNIRQAILKNEPPEEALKRIADEWKQLDAKLGDTKSRIELIRLSLGLSR